MTIMQIHECGELFREVQVKKIFPDSKTFADCIPLRSVESICVEYSNQKSNAAFDLPTFVREHFALPIETALTYVSDPSLPLRQHLETLWAQLLRRATIEQGSIIPLPRPYIVPGGRFREIYYWDSYFTMLGLQVSGRFDIISDMLTNFGSLIERFGFIPNGNRTYYLSRSQPPFFSLMVELARQQIGNEIFTTFGPLLEKEYQFWMKYAEGDETSVPGNLRVVRMSDGSLLNRYWDSLEIARPEAYRETLELAIATFQSPKDLYRNIRAACESGWDFSSRWFSDGKSFTSIHTTDLIALDLNCLLYDLEKSLSRYGRSAGDNQKYEYYSNLAEKRKAAILKYCWNDDAQFFFDYNFKTQRSSERPCLVAAFPLFFKIATSEQAAKVAERFEQQFLKVGGLTTTLENSGQQWDAPNGWAPLQWIAYKGLLNYGHTTLAHSVRDRWMEANEKVYAHSGRMTEKYNVWSAEKGAGGGEYPNQDGFGWSNGVYLAMVQDKLKG